MECIVFVALVAAIGLALIVIAAAEIQAEIEAFHVRRLEREIRKAAAEVDRIIDCARQAMDRLSQERQL